jgi:hypothetical protein
MLHLNFGVGKLQVVKDATADAKGSRTWQRADVHSDASSRAATPYGMICGRTNGTIKTRVDEADSEFT